MKNRSFFNQLTSLVLLVVLVTTGCTEKKQAVYNRLMEHANSIKVVNSHEHQRNPAELGINEYNFWSVLSKAYVNADLVSAGGNYLSNEVLNNSSLDKLWEENGKSLNYSKNTSYYRHFLKGFQILYDYKESCFTREGISQLSETINKNYHNYGRWFEEAFNKANFETMLLDQFWAPFNLDIDTNFFTLIFPVNNLVYFASNAKNLFEEESEPAISEYKNKVNIEGISSLAEYMDFVDYMLKQAIEKGAVGLKNSMAYGRSIYYENVPVERASELFEKSPELSWEESKAIQDFVFHWILTKAAEYNLPVQIHTGYLAGNGNNLENGKPVKLNNLFIEHPETKFSLFHGGFPWTGEFTAYGKMFKNVYPDLVWLPQISKERAITTFDEMLDCVPYNKILWGGDCQFIEESVGSLEFGKEIVVEVLSKRIREKKLDKTTAKHIIESIFRENAIALFNLNYTTVQ